MIIYLCIKYKSNILIFSKDIKGKPFFVRTVGTYEWDGRMMFVWSDSDDTKWQQILSFKSKHLSDKRQTNSNSASPERVSNPINHLKCQENLHLKMSVYVFCWIFLQTFQTYCCIPENSVDPDQTAPRGAVWSGSTLFAKMTFKITSR